MTPGGTLKRQIGLGLLTSYGVGVMVGAGIYVLVGIVAGSAGIWTPLAFLLAALVALPSALSYCELTTRMPEAAGEVAYVEAGFGRRWLGLLVGLAIVVSAIVAAGAVLRGGVGYLVTFVPVADSVAIVAGGVLLTLVAVAGALRSLAFAALFTVIEVVGLLLVSWAGMTAAPVAEWLAPPPPEMLGVIGAVSLCFFAFIGFEDLANMAEEVRDPNRIMPRGILLALAITAALYGLVSLAAVRSVPAEALASSAQPLALVWQTATGGDPRFLSAIAVAAAVNGVLAQIVMAARVLLGVGRRSRGLSMLAQVGARSGTPVRASLLVGGAVILSALALPVAALAEIASLVLLAIFALVNAALIAIKRSGAPAPFRVPVWVPWAGLLSALAALLAALAGLV